MQMGQKHRVDVAAGAPCGQKPMRDATTTIDQQPTTGATIDKIGRAMTIKIDAGTTGAKQDQFHYPYNACKRSP